MGTQLLVGGAIEGAGPFAEEPDIAQAHLRASEQRGKATPGGRAGLATGLVLGRRPDAGGDAGGRAGRRTDANTGTGHGMEVRPGLGGDRGLGMASGRMRFGGAGGGG